MRRLLSALLVLILLAGCAPAQPVSAGASFTDDLGRTVTVETPGRVAALLGSFAQIWTLAGGSICAAPDDAWTELGLALADDAVNLGSTHSLSLELLLAAEPELILASTNTRQSIQWRDTLEATGIPVAYFDVNDFADYLRLLKLFTDLTGEADRYTRYGLAVQEQIDAVVARSKKRLETQPAPTVLCLTATASGIHTKNSAGSVLSRILERLGCINPADSNAMLLEQISMEQILLEDPDYIFFIRRGDDQQAAEALVQTLLTEDPAWASLSAVRQGQVYVMDKQLFNLKPNHRWGEAYEQVEAILSHEA